MAVSITSNRTRRVLALVVGGALALAATACSPDPTSSGFAFRFLNDTGTTVKVTYCDNARCTKSDWTETVAAGQRLPANTSAEGFDESYKFVRVDNGAIVGCKTLNFKHKQQDL